MKVLGSDSTLNSLLLSEVIVIGHLPFPIIHLISDVFCVDMVAIGISAGIILLHNVTISQGVVVIFSDMVVIYPGIVVIYPRKYVISWILLSFRYGCHLSRYGSHHSRCSCHFSFFFFLICFFGLLHLVEWEGTVNAEQTSHVEDVGLKTFIHLSSKSGYLTLLCWGKLPLKMENIFMEK